MIEVFVSYRSDDTRPVALRIHEHLAQAMDEEAVFIDRQPFPDIPGLVERVKRSDVLLVIIGEKWLKILNEKQQAPIGEDWVLEEIQAGLTTDGVFVVPVLIDDPKLHPQPALLPAQIAMLGYKVPSIVRQEPDAFREDMKTLLHRIKNRHNVRYCGVTKVHPKFPVDIFRRYVHKARHRIRVLSIWTGIWNNINEALRNAVVNGADVEILLLHPDNPCAIQRSHDLGFHDEWSSENIRNNIRTLHSLVSIIKRDHPTHAGNIRLKLYHGVPSRVIFMADETALIGSHPMGLFANDSPHTEVYGNETDLFLSVNNHFDRIWNSDGHTIEIDLTVERLDDEWRK
jgi:hypothetical protein